MDGWMDESNDGGWNKITYVYGLLCSLTPRVRPHSNSNALKRSDGVLLSVVLWRLREFSVSAGVVSVLGFGIPDRR